MEFSRPEYWSRYLSLLQGIVPAQGSNTHLLHAGRFFTRWVTREAFSLFINALTYFQSLSLIYLISSLAHQKRLSDLWIITEACLVISSIYCHYFHDIIHSFFFVQQLSIFYKIHENQNILKIMTLESNKTRIESWFWSTQALEYLPWTESYFPHL